MRVSSSTWAKFGSPARCAIILAEVGPSSNGTTTDAFIRESREVHSATCHLLVACVSAADRSRSCAP